MIDLTNIDYVKGLQSNMHSTFSTSQGKEILKFLEEACGWYQSIFDPSNRDLCLINDGKRQVLATIKTLLERTADEIVSLAKQREGV